MRVEWDLSDLCPHFVDGDTEAQAGGLNKRILIISTRGALVMSRNISLAMVHLVLSTAHEGGAVNIVTPNLQMRDPKPGEENMVF
jgi:hypothetical protein